MNYKRKLEKVLESVQQERNCSRTEALYELSRKYDVSYLTLWTLGKRGKVPKQARVISVLRQIIKDYGFFAETIKRGLA